MPHYDFKKPMTFFNALEQYALAYHCALTALRNEVKFADAGDEAILNAANSFYSMLEDARPEVSRLANELERRILAMKPV